MKFFFDDAALDDQLKRSAAAAYCGAADLGEILVIASAITSSDPSLWYEQWSEAAERAEALAIQSTSDQLSAAGAWLRATEYWRQAFFFLRADLGDDRIHTGWSRHRAAFRAALSHLPLKANIASLPFGECHLTGYLLCPGGDEIARPTIVLPAGYDSTAESGYADTAWMALSRGYNAFTLEGPGQGGALYAERVAMRPDFEAVLSPALDWLQAQPGVDHDRIVLVGRSYAGYLAPRAAAFEPRIAALVCDPGQVEFISRIMAMLSQKSAISSGLTWSMIAAAEPKTDAMLQQLQNVPAMRSMMAPRMPTLGATSVGDFLRKQAAFSLEGVAELIRCPTLVVDCEGDFASQSDMLFAALTCPKKLERLSTQSGAGGHCGGLGQQVWAATVFPWLATTLGVD